jgi:NAD(P)-dependent dehydrogenase (short-subunit alcohol dehydrogenase family)
MTEQKSIALVTGASSGIGLATASLFHQKGYRVYGASRSVPTRNVPFQTLELNVIDPFSIANCIETILRREGRIDILINCAGYGIAGPLEMTSDQEILKQFDVNVFGTLRMIRAVIPSMRKSGKGKIITVSSIAGIMGLPFQGAYSASKAALDNLHEALYMELQSDNISIHVVSPGDVNTNFTQNRNHIQQNITGTVYAESFPSAIEQIGQDEQNGISAEKVARTIADTAENSSLRFRRICASPVQKLAVLLKLIMPYRMFNDILRRHYLIDKHSK